MKKLSKFPLRSEKNIFAPLLCMILFSQNFPPGWFRTTLTRSWILNLQSKAGLADWLVGPALLSLPETSLLLFNDSSRSPEELPPEPHSGFAVDRAPFIEQLQRLVRLILTPIAEPQPSHAQTAHQERNQTDSPESGSPSLAWRLKTAYLCAWESPKPRCGQTGPWSGARVPDVLPSPKLKRISRSRTAFDLKTQL